LSYKQCLLWLKKGEIKFLQQEQELTMLSEYENTYTCDVKMNYLCIEFFYFYFRPADPLEFIANYLLKEAKNRSTQTSETAAQAIPSASA
jgi:hypothetical protein